MSNLATYQIHTSAINLLSYCQAGSCPALCWSGLGAQGPGVSVSIANTGPGQS